MMLAMDAPQAYVNWGGRNTNESGVKFVCHNRGIF